MQTKDVKQTCKPIYHYFFSLNFIKCLIFSANDSVSQFEISRNKQEFVRSPFVSGKDKLAKYSLLNSLYGSAPKVNS